MEYIFVLQLMEELSSTHIPVICKLIADLIAKILVNTMSTGRSVLVICMFLLASSSHLQAARVLATNYHRVHDKMVPVSTSSSGTGSASPCLHDARLPALSSPLVNEPADDITGGGGHGRALWSTPSDGVGH